MHTLLVVLIILGVLNLMATIRNTSKLNWAYDSISKIESVVVTSDSLCRTCKHEASWHGERDCTASVFYMDNGRCGCPDFIPWSTH
jgi:hypothetical protein